MIARLKTICAAGVDSKMSDVDGLPYSTLLYGNGPGFSQPRPVPSNSSSSEMAGRNSVHGAAVPRQWATHGGEDVPIYAQVSYAFVLVTLNRSTSNFTRLIFLTCI
jgi:alkaline phosphatase